MAFLNLVKNIKKLKSSYYYFIIINIIIIIFYHYYIYYHCYLKFTFVCKGATLEIITDRSQEGAQFCKGFGGIGGMLP